MDLRIAGRVALVCGSSTGLGRAVDYALALGIGEIETRVRALAVRLRRDLEGVPGVTLHDIGQERCGIVTFSHAAAPADRIKASLGARAVHVSVSQPSGALLDATARDLPDLVRASPHYYNTEAELDAFLEALAEAVRN